MTFNHDRKFFDTTDFVVFAITLIIPISIGIYYSFISKKKPKTISEYLVGNRNMDLFPITMSLGGSVISGFFLIGPISEVYFYGAQYILVCVATIIGCSFFVIIYLPVFYNLKVTSTFEYLQKRFDYKVRLFGSLLFVIKTIVSMAVWIYAPVLMLEQVVGISLNILIPIVSGICIFYTFGGVRGVIWADTFQTILMLLGLIAIVVVGVYKVGGIKTIFEINEQGGRLQVFDCVRPYKNFQTGCKHLEGCDIDTCKKMYCLQTELSERHFPVGRFLYGRTQFSLPSFDWDPRLNQSFWIIMVGFTISHIGYFTTSQFVVQRCVSLSTLLKSEIAVAVMQIIVTATIFFSCFVGIIVYAAFHDCDPYSVESISKPDQLLPYFIMNLKMKVPTLPSMVISIVFCAALSSLSSGLNSTSGVIMIDFIQPFSKRPITDAQGSFYMKIITIFLGVVYTGITFTLNNATNLVRLTLSLISASLGANLGIFTLGVLLPWANEFGALIGGIAGAVIVAWISVGNQMTSGVKILSSLPLSIENCGNFTVSSTVNQTSVIRLIADVLAMFLSEIPSLLIKVLFCRDERFFLYAISPHYYTLIGAFITIAIGMVISYFTGLNKVKDMDPKLFSPVIQQFLKTEETTCEMSNMGMSNIKLETKNV